MRVLVLGASGMLGNAVFRFFSADQSFVTCGAVRSEAAVRMLPKELHASVIRGIDVTNPDHLAHAVEQAAPDAIINCIGLVKQLSNAEDPLEAIPINSLLPHRLAHLCKVAGARLVHMSTDCVFSGDKGMYVEDDQADARDLYGRSKLLGEVDYPHAITLRTSIIGHELDGARSLIGWFLAQEGSTQGFRKAIFSGLPTVEIARTIRDCVLPRPELHGVFHLSAEPINKLELLRLVAKAYGKAIDIHPSDKIVIDRSLDSTRFRRATGFSPKPWHELIQAMERFR